MNRKLKKLLRDVYAAEYPDRKNVFIQQLKAESAWRRRHPISSFIGLHPTLMPISAAMTAITACVILVMIAFNGNKAPHPDTPPDIITEMTVTTSQSTDPASNDDIVTTVISDDIKTEAVKSDSLTKKDKKKSNSISNAVNISQQTKLYNTTAIKPTSATTSIYDTEFFRHDYTTEEASNDEELIWGYLNYNIFPDMFKFVYERNNPNADFDKDFVDITTAELSESFKTLILSWDIPSIIEGKITALDYIAYKGKPWTICEITITKVYNFNSENILNIGDKIKIIYAGGYMPVSEYIALNPDDMEFADWTDEQINSTVIYDAGSNQNEAKLGDSFMYLLEKFDYESALGSYLQNEYPELSENNLYIRELYSDIMQLKKIDNNYVSCNTNYENMCVMRKDIEHLLNQYDILCDPDSDRKIAFKNESSLLYGAFTIYSIDSDDRWTYIDYVGTDDGYYPFNDDFTETRDKQGRPMLCGKTFTMTWTDTGIILDCFDYDFTQTLEFKISE